MRARPGAAARAVAAMDAMITTATRLPPATTWALTAVGLAGVAAGDYLTGLEVWFGPIYLLLICLPAWALGARAGLAVGVLCLFIGLSLNGSSIYPAGGIAFLWNVAMRILSVIFVVILVAGIRRSHDREWRNARTDHLTGALTRQGFFEAQALKPVSRRWGVLAYLDLDGFKAVNDRHGHAAGDEVLRLFADVVREAIGPADSFARIGGDEFMLHIVVDDETAGRRMIERLHGRINAALDRGGYGAACSMGALVLEPRSGAVHDADIARADDLMYMAKRNGAGSLRVAAPTAAPKSPLRIVSAAA